MEKKGLGKAYFDQKKSEKRRKMWEGGEVEPSEMSEKDVEEQYDEHSDSHSHNEFCPEGCELGEMEEEGAEPMVVIPLSSALKGIRK